jgi:hypothetical protein
VSWTALHLEGYLDVAIATFDGERRRGVLNPWGNSFPAEELPFGSTLTLGGVPFRLPPKRPGEPDSFEALGQSIGLPGAPRAHGIALLCYGEMGEQYVSLRVVGRDERALELTATARGSTVPAGFNPGEEGIVSSHLHYPGDYDLDLVRVVLWRYEHRWGDSLEVFRLELGTNPLFHVLAIALLDAETSRG